MRSILVALAFVFLAPDPSIIAATEQNNSARIQLQLNTDEADQVLAILAKRASGENIRESDWHSFLSPNPTSGSRSAKLA